MWSWTQAAGALLHDGNPDAEGFSGHGDGYNNPALQNVPNVGPLPQGHYTIGSPYTHPKLGPVVMDLEPDPSNEMFGRNEFRIHGALISDPADSSHGCIVLARVVRERIAASGDDHLEVIA